MKIVKNFHNARYFESEQMLKRLLHLSRLLVWERKLMSDNLSKTEGVRKYYSWKYKQIILLLERALTILNS